MFDENQLVEIEWTNKTKAHYIEHGYNYTKNGDRFYVKANDLPEGSHKKVAVVCDGCGREMLKSYYDYNKTKDKSLDLCRSCQTKHWRSKEMSELAKIKFEQLRKFCYEKNYTLLTNESEYSGAHMSIKYICSKHGVQIQPLDNMLHGHECYYCSYEKRGLNQRYTFKQVKEIIESVNGNILLNPEDYIGIAKSNLRIRCGICCNVYVTNLDHYINQNQTRCRHCSYSESLGEFYIRKFFEKHNVRFEQEKRFADCKDKKTLPFDFYLPDYNMCVEFDGQIHYSEIGYGNHDITVVHDKIKNDYCKFNNIKLLRIPYYEGNNIESILTKELNL